MSTASDRRPVVAVLLQHGFDVRRWRARHAAGEVLDETPYGYGLAEERFDLRWSVDHRESRLARTVRRAITELTGADLVHVWRNRRLLDGADVVWTHVETEHLAVAALRRLLPRVPVIGQSVWLWDRMPARGPKRALLLALVARLDLELVLSRVNRDLGAAAVPGRRIARVPFGTAAPPRSVIPDAAPEPLVLAPGNDRDRDWAVLLEAARLLPDARFLIASALPFFDRLELPPNVVHERHLGREAIADAYARAAVVAVPLRPNAHASGITVAIEALARACPVVASDAGGIDEYLDGAEAVLTPPGDAAALAAALAPFVARPHRAPGNRDVPATRGLLQRDYVRRFELATLAVLRGGWDPRIETFAPVD